MKGFFMQSFLFFVVVGVISIIGVLINRLLIKFSPTLLLIPVLSLFILIGLSLYFARTMEGLGALGYVIYLLVLIPVVIVVGIDAIILTFKSKKAAK
jgi:hypothetical protein